MLGRLTDPEIAHRRRWLTLLVLCLSLMVIGIDNTILNVAIPTLAKPTSAGGLGASASELQWIVDAYTIVFAGLLLTAGSLGDRFGRYRALTIGLVIFGVGSALSAFAPSATVLIGTRALMGIGASAIMPATLSILTNVFHDPRERAKAIGVWAGVSAIGIGIGPDRRWRAAPALLVGLGVPRERPDRHHRVGCRLPARARLARPRAPDGSTRSDRSSRSPGSRCCCGPSSKARAAAGARPRCSAASSSAPPSSPGSSSGSSSARTPCSTCGSSRTHGSRRRVARSPSRSSRLFGTIFLLTQYLQQVLGYSTVKAGAIFLPQSIVLMIFAPMSTRWVRKFGNKAVVATGLFVLAVALALMATFQTDSSAYLVVGITALSAFGMAHVVAPATESIMGSLPRAKAGVGSAMNDTTRQVGGAVGVALLGSILASAFRPHVRDLLQGRVPGSLLARVEDSLGSALGVARDVPSARPYATRIVSAAQTSFVNGMHAAVLVAAAIAVIGGIGVLVWLPARARPHPDDVVEIEHEMEVVTDDALTASATPAGA